MKNKIIFTIFIIGLCSFVNSIEVDKISDSLKEVKDGSRNAKFFPIFQVVKFKNTACTGNVGRNGTCYTSTECITKGGISEGSCASDYGVCCTFTGSCGSSLSENNTYFESASSNQGAGQCRFMICRCSSTICQLRLDFESFVITGPSTDKVKVATKGFINGLFQAETKAGVSASATASQCVTDVFSVTNPGGIVPSPICGTNSDTHMYVDASESCNDLAFQLGSSATGTTLTSSRRWRIKISQYDCSYNNLAPSGCTQYHFGSDTTGTIKSYNYDGGQHLADQKQVICIRRERGKCRVCYTTPTSDFEVSHNTAIKQAKTEMCCSYGTKGTKTTGYDCLEIPGLANTKGELLKKHSKVCGRIFGSKGAATDASTICSDRYPFKVNFLTDHHEFVDEAKKADIGFKLTYYQVAGNCS